MLRRLAIRTWGDSPAAWLRAVTSLTALDFFDGPMELASTLPVRLAGLALSTRATEKALDCAVCTVPPPTPSSLRTHTPPVERLAILCAAI